MQYRIRYKINGKEYQEVCVGAGEHMLSRLTLEIEETMSLSRVILKVKEPVELEEFSFNRPMEMTDRDRLFFNGYQSWTHSREYRPGEKMKGISHLPKNLVEKYGFAGYGDYDFADYSGNKGELHGFSYGYIRRGQELSLFGSLSERNGFTLFYADEKNQTLLVEKEGGSKLPQGDHCLLSVCFLTGEYEEVFDEYFQLLKIQPRRNREYFGYTSWYRHYQNINEAVLGKAMDGIKEGFQEAEVFQIDDGYQTAVGDWLSIDENKFPEGMKKQADLIKAKGMVPGIWLAPFSCEKNSDVFRKHPDWLQKDSQGNPRKAGGNWSGCYALNLQLEPVRDYLKQVFRRVFDDWGFELVKLDFLYCACLLPQEGKTRGQLMCEGMDFLRECVGDHLMLACGVPLFPAFGVADFCRIGPDVSLKWDDVWYMKWMHRERISTRHSIENAVFRRHLNKRAFLNDPDVFLLRDREIQLSRQQRELLCRINYLTGGVLFTSDDPGEYESWQKMLLQEGKSLQNSKIISAQRIGKKLEMCLEDKKGLSQWEMNLQTGGFLKKCCKDKGEC